MENNTEVNISTEVIPTNSKENKDTQLWYNRLVIYTDKGNVPINDIKLGDNVRTYFDKPNITDVEYAPVVKLWKRNEGQKIYKLSFQKMQAKVFDANRILYNPLSVLTVTERQKFLVYEELKNDGEDGYDIIDIKKYEWVTLEEFINNIDSYKYTYRFRNIFEINNNFCCVFRELFWDRIKTNTTNISLEKNKPYIFDSGIVSMFSPEMGKDY